MMDVKWSRMAKLLQMVSLCCICLGMVSCRDKQSRSLPALPLPAMKVAFSTVPLYKQYIGITKSIDAVEIRARVEGFLEKMLFEEGTPVKKGDLLFVIDQKPFQAKVDRAHGELDKSIAERDYQRVQYIRMKELVKNGNVSQTQYDMVTSKYKEALADVEIARAKLESAEIELGYCSMYAFEDGVIGKKYADVGNLVGGKADRTVLANVVVLNPIYVQFSPSVEDYGVFLKYRKQAPFKVEVTLPHQEALQFDGQVELINNEANIDTSTIFMRATIQNPERLLLPGIYVTIKVLLTTNDKAILIPSSAIIKTEEQRSVLVVNAKHQVETRNITEDGSYQDQTIVTSGLNVGDVVITHGLQKVRPGSFVDPIFTSSKT